MSDSNMPCCVLSCSCITAGLPAGVCTSDAQCPTGFECNLKNSTRVCRCSGGFDACQPPPATGRCQAKPPPLPELTRWGLGCDECWRRLLHAGCLHMLTSDAAHFLVVPFLCTFQHKSTNRCETCQRCISTFSNYTATEVTPTATATELATRFRAFCISPAVGRPSAACDRVEKAIGSSYKGNMGRRLGAICRVLGECDAGLATNATCQLSSNSKAGTLSDCSVQGVSTGDAVDGITSSTGESLI